MLWYQKKLTEVYQDLQSSEVGLTQIEVANRLKVYGPNSLPETPVDSIFKIFVKQFQSSLIYVLLIAAIIVLALGEWVDGAVIVFVLLLNATIGSIQEGRAQQTLQALRRFVSTRARVIRDGREYVLDDRELVPGDIFLLNDGDKVPADARLIEVTSLQIDEAALTGESEPVTKIIDDLEPKELLPAEQKNMIFRGTYVLAGSAKALVVSTGQQTMIGQISKALEQIDAEMPLKANIRQLSRLVMILVAIFGVIILTLGLWRGIDLAEMFIIVVAVSVSLIPEGLPVVITVILATGVWRMSKHNALVKRLQAVEALGQAKVIAVDKTGTITKNQMMVNRLYVGGQLYKVSGSGYAPEGDITLEGRAINYPDHPDLLLAGKIATLLANANIAYDPNEKEWQRQFGDPTDAALLVFGQKLAYERDQLLQDNPLRLELSFSSTTQYHAMVNEDNHGRVILSVAGAPEVILAMCHTYWSSGRHLSLDHNTRSRLRETLESMLAAGDRVLALAVEHEAHKVLKTNKPGSLCLVGFIGMSDVIRAEVAEAVAKSHQAGVRVVMITGDHLITAKAIGVQAGIYHEGDEAITGVELMNMDIPELAARLDKVTIFARVTPEHKLKIIEAYKSRREIIAMTGDGVNDALSLAAADLGVAMGKIGTEVAKEASDIILLDDNLGSIVDAIEEGRNIYRTIKKVVLYLFSTGLGEVLTIGGAIALGYPIPLTASQIIWLNLVTDGFLVLALAAEPKSRQVLDRQWQQTQGWLVDKLMFGRMVLMGSIMTIGALTLFSLYNTVDVLRAQTVALTILAVFQWFNAWNCRSESRSIFNRQWWSNRWLIISSIIAASLQLLVVYWPPMQSVFRTVPLDLNDWSIIVGVALMIVVTEEIRKLISRLKQTPLIKRAFAWGSPV